MNYEPNTTTWPIGALVLHDCDAKRADMLMRVVRYLPSGHVRAEYVDDDRRRRQLRRVRDRQSRARRWLVARLPSDGKPLHGWFDLCDLHDPERFGVVTGAAPAAATDDEGG